jgi:SAM-dependent methyltransferase
LWNEALERTAVRDLLSARLPDVDTTPATNPAASAATNSDRNSPTGLPTDPATILDAGCATGAHSQWLLTRGVAVVGIDISPAMISMARHRTVEYAGRARFLEADLEERLPFGDATFVGVLCSLTLHYLEDITRPLAEFARVLKPRGWVLVTLDHPAGAGGQDPTRDYFETRLVTDTWAKKAVEVTQAFWGRPLSAVVDAFATAGLLIERIAEPRLDDQARRRFPEEAATIEGRPTFIGYLAVPA